MKNWRWYLQLFLFFVIAPLGAMEAEPCCDLIRPQTLFVDIGGTYTWMSLSTPPTYSGNTGGVLAKITYHASDCFFAQARSFYNAGFLTNSENNSHLQESYSEFVAGYPLGISCWNITPYVGLGFDFLFDNHTGYGSVAPLNLKYTIYYAIAGLETYCIWPHWRVGLRLDCLPTFNQYLKVSGLSGAAWTLTNRTGAEVQLPFCYRCAKKYCVELTPYYRFFPIGSSDALSLPSRDLNQWGFFVSLGTGLRLFP